MIAQICKQILSKDPNILDSRWRKDMEDPVEIVTIHTYLFCKNCVESKSESDDEKCTNDRELEKSLKNISEHHHVNAKERKLSHIG